jgi:hypothetical protein
VVNQIKTKWTVKSWREPVHYKRGVCVVYLREMQRTKLILLAICFLATLWTNVMGQELEHSSEGMLEPNSIYYGVDGVGIDTQFAILKGTPKIIIKRIEDISSFPALSPNPIVVAVTPYYEITVPEDIDAGPVQENDFTISVPLPPLPANVSPENLAVFTLADNADVEAFPPPDEPLTEGYTWFSSPATYVAATNEVIFGRGGFSSTTPFRFVIVSGVYGPVQ